MGRQSEDEYRFSENAIEWLSGERYCTVTVSQRKWIDLLKTISRARRIKRITVNLDGTVTARIPIEWVKIIPKEEENEFIRNQ